MPSSIQGQGISAHQRAAQHQFTPDKSRLPKGIKLQKKGEQNLDKNSYLKLLITELSRQDPLNPVNDKEFISQMAQFSALEQMQNVASSVNGLKNFQATSLVGKIVAGSDFVHGKELSGKVDGVIFDASGDAILRVGGRTMRLQDIKSVSEPQRQAPIVSRETINSSNHIQAVEQYKQNQSKAEMPIKNTGENREQQGETKP